MTKITEDELEQHSLDVFRSLDYEIINGRDIEPEGRTPERKDFQQIVLTERLKRAVDKLNPQIPESAKEEAIKRVLRTSSPNQIIDNEQFHKLLVEGVDVEFRKDGRVVGDKVWLVDFDNPEKNEFLAINQFTIIEDKYNRRPDIILFVNGLPLVVFELKNIAKEKATIDDAFQQLHNYKTQIPSLFRFNELLIISDGILAEAGTISSSKDRFMPWKTINGILQEKDLSIETLIRGMTNKKTLLELIKSFIVFEKDKETIKKVASYHQYEAVNRAVESTIKATRGNKKAGVVWHTQGSGKSLSMIFYAGKLAKPLAKHNLFADLGDRLFQPDWREVALAAYSLNTRAAYEKWPMGTDGFVSTPNPDTAGRILQEFGLSSRAVGKLEAAVGDRTGVRLVAFNGQEVYFSGKD